MLPLTIRLVELEEQVSDQGLDMLACNIQFINRHELEQVEMLTSIQYIRLGALEGSWAALKA